MTDLMKLIQEADFAAVEFERTRAQVESVKQTLEMAKEAQEQARLFLDDVLGRADEIGIPRAKIKKLIEERTQCLVASGLVMASSDIRPMPKPPRTPRKPKTPIDMEKDFAADDQMVSVELN